MEKSLDQSNYLNPTPDTGHDVDLLTAQELLAYGYEKARKRHKQTVARKCSDCGKPVAEPVVAYEWHGIPLMDKGEILHTGCLTRRKNGILKALKAKLASL